MKIRRNVHTLAEREAATEATLTKLTFAPHSSEHLHHTIMRNDPFWVRVVSDERLLAIASSFLREPDGIALFSSHYFCKQGGTGQVITEPRRQTRAAGPMRPRSKHVLLCCVPAERCISADLRAPMLSQRVLWHQDGSYWPLRPVTGGSVDHGQRATREREGRKMWQSSRASSAVDTGRHARMQPHFASSFTSTPCQ